jgi:predicted nucleotide-binding protein
VLEDEFADAVERAAKKRQVRRKPRAFIVHGHDEENLKALVNLITTDFKWPQPTVLRDLPARGRTIIEKFEAVADQADVVFVLITPDDRGFNAVHPEELKPRARQNVIFELGYFLAKLQRTGGRVVLLLSSQIEMPSDVSQIGYVDISQGVSLAAPKIRNEVSEWFR